jgi:hypothetical protein
MKQIIGKVHPIKRLVEAAVLVNALLAGCAGQTTMAQGAATAATATVSPIHRLTPQITWATLSQIPYGTPLSHLQLNATANVPGTFVYTPAAGTILAAGKHTVSAAFTPASELYEPVTTSQKITVTAANLSTSIYWENPQPVGVPSAEHVITFKFEEPTLVRRFQVVTQGAVALDFTDAGTGSCTRRTYSSGDSCTVNVVFNPTALGMRSGAIVGLGNPVYVAGWAAGGGQLVFDPGTPYSWSPAEAFEPISVAVDGSGNAYVGDKLGLKIYKISPGGTFSTYVNDLSSPPYALAVDGAGNLFYTTADSVVEVSPNRIQTAVVTGLSQPRGLTVSLFGNVFIANTEANTIVVYSPSTGASETLSTGHFLKRPVGLAWDYDGEGADTIWTTEDSEDHVVAVQVTESPGSMPSTRAGLSYSELTFPGVTKIATADDTFLFIADPDNHQISEWPPMTPSPIIGGTVLGATLVPTAIAVDRWENLYIPDEVNGRVLFVDRKNPPRLNFARTLVGTTSPDSPQTLSVQNIGATLDLPIPASGTNPGVSANFLLSTLSSGDFPGKCATSGDPIVAGYLPSDDTTPCTYAVSFSPNTGGNITGSVVFDFGQQTVAGLAGGQLTIPLSGVGVSPPPTLSPNDLAFQTTAGTASSAQAFTLRDLGATSVAISSTSITGPGAHLFSVTGTTCGQSPAALPCTYSVVFNSTKPGTFAATITVKTANGNATAALRGTAVPAPLPVYSPDPLVVQTVVGTTSSAQTLNLFNPGTSSITLSSPSITGNSASLFSVSATGTNCTTSLAALANCQYSITFAPTAEGSFTATFSVMTTGGTANLFLFGASVPPPTAAQAVLSPATLTVPTQAVGVSSSVQTLTLTNTGGLPLTGIQVPSPIVSGSGAAAFTLQGGGCGSTLNPGADCVFSFIFYSLTPGTFTATFTIMTAVGNQTATLTGTVYPEPTLTPASVGFGPQPQGTSSAAQTITLTNPTTGSLTNIAAGITGTWSNDYVVTNSTCGTTLPPPPAVNSCTYTVVFTPSTSNDGPVKFNVTGNYSSPIGPQQLAATATLAGSTASPAVATMVPASLTFGSPAVGTASAPQTVTLGNTGGSPLTINSAPSFTGTGASDFTYTLVSCDLGTHNGVGVGTLPANGACLYAVTFDPTAPGAAAVTMSIATSAGTAAVSMTGKFTAPAQAVLSPATLTFPTQAIGVSSSVQTLTLTNTGGSPLTGIQVPSPIVSGSGAAAFTLQGDGCGSTLNPGADCVFSFIFYSLTPGTYTATVTIMTAVGNQAATLTGTVYPAPTLTPASVGFAPEPQGTSSAAQNITLTNPTAGSLTNIAAGITGTWSNDYVVTNSTCGTTLQSLPAVNSCTYTVVFTPSTSNDGPVKFNVTGNYLSPIGPQQLAATATLAGSTASPAVATMAPASLTFGSPAVGTASAPQTVTLGNTGGSPLTINSAPSFAGTGAVDFTYTLLSCDLGTHNGVGVGTLPPNGACIYAVTFDPTAPGAAAVTMSIATSAGTATVSLTGNFTAPAQAVLSPATLTVPTQAVGVSSSVQTLTLTNTGGSPLTGIQVPNPIVSGSGAAAFTLQGDGCGSTLNPGADCVFNFIFYSLTPGTYTATVTIETAVGDQTATLTGTATAQ